MPKKIHDKENVKIMRRLVPCQTTWEPEVKGKNVRPYK